MHFSISNSIFLFTLITGTTITISSLSWFSAWIGLELNLMSFIPIMAKSNNQYTSEGTLKYFLIQALGSSIFITSILLNQIEMSSLAHSMMFYALLLKLGAAPFHFWFPQVMNGLLWPQVVILMTIQKVAPLFLLFCLYSMKPMMFTLCLSTLLSAVLGALGGINQTSFRKIFAFSSINHIGWLLSSIMVNEYVMTIYFLFYCFISISIVLILNYFQLFHFNQLSNLSISPEIKILMFFSLLSLGGLPPFSGFVPKWIIIQNLSSSSNFLILFFLLFSALMTLYFYLRISLFSFSLSFPDFNKVVISHNSFQLLPFLIFINFFGILTPFLFTQ